MKTSSSPSASSRRKPLLLWAVDPFTANSKLQREAAWALQALSRQRSFRIRPVFVAGNPVSGLPASMKIRWVSETRAAAQAGLEKLLRGIELENVEPIVMLESNGYSTRRMVQTLIDYAQKTRPTLVVASTRARKGPARWFVGSFTESLSLHCESPLFLVNPSWRRQSRFDEIFFPTNLSEGSHRAYRDVLRFALDTGMSVHLFHQYEYRVFPVFDLGYAGAAYFPDLEKEEIQSCRRTGEEWAEEGRSAGVPTRFELDTQTARPAVEAILRKCKRGACLMALAPEASAHDRTFGGSVSRRLIRESTAPIWLIHRPESQVGKPRAIPRRAGAGARTGAGAGARRPSAPLRRPPRAEPPTLHS